MPGQIPELSKPNEKPAPHRQADSSEDMPLPDWLAPGRPADLVEQPVGSLRLPAAGFQHASTFLPGGNRAFHWRCHDAGHQDRFARLADNCPSPDIDRRCPYRVLDLSDLPQAPFAIRRLFEEEIIWIPGWLQPAKF